MVHSKNPSQKTALQEIVSPYGSSSQTMTRKWKSLTYLSETEYTPLTNVLRKYLPRLANRITSLFFPPQKDEPLFPRPKPLLKKGSQSTSPSLPAYAPPNDKTFSRIYLCRCQPFISSSKSTFDSLVAIQEAAHGSLRALHLAKVRCRNTSQNGSTNMSIFGRAHECKEYEHWSKKKVWIVSGMKWTLSKNKGDPQRTLVKPELTQAKRWTQTRL